MKKIVIFLFSIFLLSGIVGWGQDQKKEQQKKQDRIHQEDHMMFKDGKLYQFKQGEQTQLQSQLRLNNGVSVNPDGSYQLQNQQRYQLRDGECLDMSGNRYLNQNKFNHRKMMTQKQIEQAGKHSMGKNKGANKGGGGGKCSGRK